MITTIRLLCNIKEQKIKIRKYVVDCFTYFVTISIGLSACACQTDIISLWIQKENRQTKCDTDKLF